MIYDRPDRMKGPEIVQSWDNGKFEEIDLAIGSTDDEDRNMGMGVIVEYANRSGEPRWTAPASTTWDYTALGKTAGTPASPDEMFDLKFEKVPGGRGGYNRWTINGKSWPETNPLFTVAEGKRYRLVMNNNSGDEHPVHMHRHSFEITKIGDKSTPA